MRKLFSFLVLFTLVSFQAHADGLELTLHKNDTITDDGTYVRVEKGADGKAVTKQNKSREEKKSDVVVTLFPHSMSIREGEALRVYDFGDKHVFFINGAKKTITPQSLYAYPIGKNAEMRNRLMMNEMFQKVFTDKNSKDAKTMQKAVQSPVDIDMLFASEHSAKATAQLKKTSGKNGAVSYHVGEREIASYTLSEDDIPAPLRDTYAKLLIYASTTHPEIKKTIYSAKKVFKTLHYSYKEAGRTWDTQLTLASVKPVPGTEAQKPDGYTTVYSDDPRIDAAIQKTLAAKRPTMNDYGARIQTYLDKEDLLRALLATMEMNIIFGGVSIKSVPAGVEAFRAAVAAPATRPVFVAVTRPPQSDDEFAIMDKIFTGAKTAAPDYGHIIDIFKAGHLMTWLEKRKKVPTGEEKSMGDAIDNYSDSISTNPWLTNAYMDLAGLRFMQYRIHEAWNLWEQAIRLSPTQEGLKRVFGMQKQAEKDFPEYF